MTALGGLPSLTIAIATMGHRLAGIQLPDPADGVDFLVTVQKPEDPFEAPWAGRNDVRVERLETVGLSRNRNAGLEMASGDLVLFSDDDVLLNMDGIHALRQAFSTQPALGLVVGWRAGRLPQTGRRSEPYRLTQLNSGRSCAPEFMVNKSKVDAQSLKFDPEFGVGAKYPIGEDYIFVTDMLKSGLSGLSLPIVAGNHPGASSGDEWQDLDLIQARRKMIGRVFGVWAPLMRVAYVAKHWRRFPTKKAIARFLF